MDWKKCRQPNLSCTPELPLEQRAVETTWTLAYVLQITIGLKHSTVRRRGALVSRIAAMQSAIRRLDLILYVFEADILFWWHHDLERPKNPRGNSSSIFFLNKSFPPSKKRLCLKEDSLPNPPNNGVFLFCQSLGSHHPPTLRDFGLPVDLVAQ